MAAVQLRRRRDVSPTAAEARAMVETADASLLDVVDNLLNKGVVLSGDVVLGLAGVDLIDVRLSVLLCAADRIVEERGE
jgi:hypothetical protein